MRRNGDVQQIDVQKFAKHAEVAFESPILFCNESEGRAGNVTTPNTDKQIFACRGLRYIDRKAQAPGILFEVQCARLGAAQDVTGIMIEESQHVGRRRQ